jgi:hypothetical protein
MAEGKVPTVGLAEAGALKIAGLDQLLADAGRRRTAPSDAWNPPYCGDIGLAIDSAGQWHYGGSPIRREAIVKVFASILRREADGRYYLVTPVEKVDVAVSAEPFLAVEMETRGAGREQTLIVRTNIDDVVTIGPDHPLSVGESLPDAPLIPKVEVRRGLHARLTRALVYDLVERAESRGGMLGVWSAGVWYPLEPFKPGRGDATRQPAS